MKYYCEFCKKNLNEDEVEIVKFDIKLTSKDQEKYGQKTICKACKKETLKTVEK